MTESVVKYSFVMPAYKAAFFKEAIDSILGQTYPDFELIIVDDASPEDLGSIVSGYADNRISYHRNEQNIGGRNLVAQWNHSISYARGKYIILASDDDVYDTEYLAEIDSLVQQYPQVSVYRTKIRKIDAAGNTISAEQCPCTGYVDWKKYLTLFSSGAYFSGIPQFTFLAESLLHNGGFVDFPAAWYSDDAIVARLSVGGMAISDRTLFSMRFSGLNISTVRCGFEMMKKKTDATLLYFDYMRSLLLVQGAESVESNDILARLIHRAKDVENEMVDAARIKDRIKILCYIRSLHSEFFPIRWQLRRVLSLFAL